MKAAHLQVSQPESEKICPPDNEISAATDEKPSLTNLAGELQDLIITNLHPSAAIALSQTSRHFHACVNLHRLPSSAVFDYFQEKESMKTHSNDYACYTCLRLKPRSAFAKRQAKGRQGKLGINGYTRICLECALSTGRLTPGSIIETGREMQVLCMGCETLRKRFCTWCRWCDSCIGKGFATVLRKGQWAVNGEASNVVIRNGCTEHVWAKPTHVRRETNLPSEQWLENITEYEDELWNSD